MRFFLIAASIAVLALGACARPRANTRPEPIALDVPAPPPREIAAPEPEEPPETPTVEPAETKERRPSRPRAASSRADQRPSDKPIEKKADPPPDANRPPASTVPPSGTLQPALPASEVEIERQVREQLGQASRDLDRVDYRAMNADGKAQYDTAKRFIEQAGAALQEKNLVFAGKLAEKAAGLAASLLGR